MKTREFTRAQTIAVPATFGTVQVRAIAKALTACADGPVGRQANSPVILRGGPQVFCNGLDLVPRKDDDANDLEESVTEYVDLLLQIRCCARTTIAVIEGAAAGGGLGIAAACDVLWATPNASFSLPEVHLGLAPNVIFPLLRQRVSAAHLRAMALDGLSRCPARMLAYGLLDEIIEAADLEPRLSALLRAMGRADPDAMEAVRAGGREDAPMLREGMLAGARRTAAMLKSPGVRRRMVALQESGAPWML